MCAKRRSVERQATEEIILVRRLRFHVHLVGVGRQNVRVVDLITVRVKREKFSSDKSRLLRGKSEKFDGKKIVKFTKLASIKSHLMPLSGLSIKTEYALSEESSSSNCSPRMVETTSPLLRARPNSPNPRLSPQSQNFLNSKMLISSQNLSYFEQRLSRNSLSDQKKSENMNLSEKHHMNGNTSASSLFTIDSILAKQTRYADMSPSSSPNRENGGFKNGFTETSPSRSSRLPPAALFQHHPGLHITHLASNFGSPEFLGEAKPHDLSLPDHRALHLGELKYFKRFSFASLFAFSSYGILHA